MSSPDVRREDEQELRLDVTLRFFGHEEQKASVAEKALHHLRAAFPRVEVRHQNQLIHEHDWFTGEELD